MTEHQYYNQIDEDERLAMLWEYCLEKCDGDEYHAKDLFNKELRDENC